MFARVKSFAKSLRHLRRDESGHAAVEFGLVALPFFLLMFGLGELGLIGFAQTSLDHAATEVSRRIRTGQAQSTGQSYQDIKDMLCDEMSNFGTLDCDTSLFLDVDTFDSYVNVSNNNPIENSELNTDDFGYSPGAASSIVVVRAFYRWRVLTPVFQGVFANLNDPISGHRTDRLLATTLMFRNEPY